MNVQLKIKQIQNQIFSEGTFFIWQRLRTAKDVLISNATCEYLWALSTDNVISHVEKYIHFNVDQQKIWNSLSTSPHGQCVMGSDLIEYVEDYYAELNYNDVYLIPYQLYFKLIRYTSANVWIAETTSTNFYFWKINDIDDIRAAAVQLMKQS